MLRVTLDTNVLIRGLDGEADERDVFTRLRALHDREVIEIGLTSRFDEDKEDDTELVRVKRHYRFARLFPVVAGPFRCDVSVIDGPDIIVGDDICTDLEALFGVTDFSAANKNTVWDVDHLYGHSAAGRDYFLTCERRILNKARQLDALGIRVLHPRRFLDAVEDAQSRAGDQGSEVSALLSDSLEGAFRGAS